MSKTGHFHNNLIESRRKRDAIVAKRHEISMTEGLLKTYEELPEEKRDYDCERRLRSKLRAKKNQLQVML